MEVQRSILGVSLVCGEDKSMSATAILQQFCPSLDSEIIEYVNGKLSNLFLRPGIVTFTHCEAVKYKQMTRTGCVCIFKMYIYIRV